MAGLHLTFTLPGCGNSVQESEVQPETTSQEPLKEPHSSETSGADGEVDEDMEAETADAIRCTALLEYGEV